MLSDATTSISPTRPIIEALTGVRGWAALWIVLYHYYGFWRHLFPPLTNIEPLVRPGPLAVDLFFILSGFVLSYNYLGHFRTLQFALYMRFLYRRLGRIYPLHVATLIAIVPVILAARWLNRPYAQDLHSAGAFLQHLLLVHAWVPHMRLTWNYPSWSISCEWFAYLWFPIFCVALHRLSNPTQRIAAAALAFFTMQAVAVAPADLPFRELFRVSGAFATGCMLYVLSTSCSRRERQASFLNALAPLAVGTIVVAPLCGFSHPSLLLTLFTILIFALGSGADRFASCFTALPFVYLGEISYSLYLTHAVVQKILVSVLPTERFATASLATRFAVFLAYAATIAAAALLAYYCVERPARQRISRPLKAQWERASTLPQAAPAPSA